MKERERLKNPKEEETASSTFFLRLRARLASPGRRPIQLGAPNRLLSFRFPSTPLRSAPKADNKLRKTLSVADAAAERSLHLLLNLFLLLSSPPSSSPRDPKLKWTNRFIAVVDLPDSYEKFSALSQLAREFGPLVSLIHRPVCIYFLPVYTAEMYARVIISEIGIPNEEKKIKPIDVGGLHPLPSPLPASSSSARPPPLVLASHPVLFSSVVALRFSSSQASLEEQSSSSKLFSSSSPSTIMASTRETRTRRRPLATTSRAS